MNQLHIHTVVMRHLFQEKNRSAWRGKKYWDFLMVIGKNNTDCLWKVNNGANNGDRHYKKIIKKLLN